MARLTKDDWIAIRGVWESVPGLSFADAASKVAASRGFSAPTKQAVTKRAKAQGWTRREAHKTVMAVPPDSQGSGSLQTERDGRAHTQGPTVQPNEAGKAASPAGKLTPRQRLFIEEYLTDLNATQAAIRAGYSEKTAQEQSSRLLSNVMVRAEVEGRMSDRMERVQVTQDQVLKSIMGVAFGDVNELVEFRRTCCRYCWGDNNLYQYTPGEFAREMAEYTREAYAADIRKQPAPPKPDVQGGTSFNRTLPPNDQCSECFGEGVGQVFVKDTRQLSPVARTLYAGVKESKDGLDLKTLSRDKAIEMLARHTNLFEDKLEVNMTVTTPDELDAIYRSKMAESAARAVSVQDRLARIDTDVGDDGGQA